MAIVEYNTNNKKVKYLIETDKKLGRLIRYIGTASLLLEEDGFKCIIKYIIGQQISDKARETIWQRVLSGIKPLNPQKVLSIPVSEFRKYGLSERKVLCIRTLAESILQREIDFTNFKRLSNDEIIKKITKIKGIGIWTAEMYLIFSLGRENVLSKSDGTIKRTIQWMYNLEKLPATSELDIFFKKWKDYSTIVSIYLWKSIELDLIKKPFDRIL